jgi:hypothetical protein
VTARILDQFGNLAISAANITVAIGANPGGGTLSGTLTVAASGGLATFNTLSINKLGTGYTLTASSGALIGATSSSFNITAATANKLAFAQQPTSATAGVAISPAVTVRILDQFDNLTTSSERDYGDRYESGQRHVDRHDNSCGERWHRNIQQSFG